MSINVKITRQVAVDANNPCQILELLNKEKITYSRVEELIKDTIEDEGLDSRKKVETYLEQECRTRKKDKATAKANEEAATREATARAQENLKKLGGNQTKPATGTDSSSTDVVNNSAADIVVSEADDIVTNETVVDIMGGVEEDNAEATENITTRGAGREIIDIRTTENDGDLGPFKETTDIGVPAQVFGNLTYNLKVKIPEPEPGYNTAKITVVTACGTSNEKEFTYLDVCVPTPPPPPDNNIIIDEDVVDAYEDCLSDINDLFCKPTEDFGGEYGFLEVTPNYSGIAASNGKVFIGTQIIPIYEIKGIGSYQFYIYAKDSEDKTIELYDSGLESINQREGETTEVFPDEDVIVLDNHYRIMIIFNAFDTTDFPDNQIATSYEVNRSVLPGINTGEEHKRLAADNDVSDSNKETYITLSSTVDLNKNLSNINELGLIEADPIRDEYGAFWILDENDTKYVYTNRDSLPTIVTSPITPDNRYIEKFVLERAVEYNTAGSVVDISYDYLKPYTKKEFDQAERPFSSRILDVKTEYNFYFKEYEEVQKDFASRRENLLPNMYYLLLKDQTLKTGRTENREDDILVDPDIDNLISLVPSELTETVNSQGKAFSREMTNPSRLGLSTSRAGFNLVGTAESFTGTQRTRGLSLQNNANTAATAIPEIKGDYYDYFIEKYKTSKIERDPSLVQRSRNVVIPYSFLPKIEEFSNKNQLFPMFADIRFDTDPNTFVTRKLKQEGLGDWFFLNCVNKFIDNSESIKEQTFLKQQEDGQYFEQTSRYIDITNIIDTLAKPEDKFVFLGDYKDYQIITAAGYNLEVEKAKFVESIKQLVKENGRTYGEILAGKKCYKEAVLYRIAKFGADKTTPIQNIWIPNDPDKNYLRYIDTQVIYEKGYTYRIYSYDLTIANEYNVSTSMPSTPTDSPSGDRPDLGEGAGGISARPDTTEESSRAEPDFSGRGSLTNPPINKSPHVPETENVRDYLRDIGYGPGRSLSPSSVQELTENITLEVPSDRLVEDLGNLSNDPNNLSNPNDPNDPNNRNRRRR